MTGTSPISMLHMFPSFSIGGQQMRLAQLTHGLGPDFHHEILSFDGDVSASTLFDGAVCVEKFKLAKSSVLSLSNFLALRTRLKTSKANIICTYNWGALEAALANRLGPRRPHIHFEDGFGPDESVHSQKTRRVMFRRLALGKSLVVTPSQTLYGVALERWRLPESHVVYIPNGVDVDRFQPQPSAQSGKVIIGTVGALRTEKNQRRLIQCFDAAGLGDEARLEIVGDGPERDALGKTAVSGNASHRIKFCGSTSLPEKSYLGFDVFALSSDTEQMPLSLLEAMATGLPVVATDVGDIKSMVATDNEPFIVPLGDDDAYAKALAILTGDAELRARLGQANRARALQEFSEDKMINAHETLYREVLGGANV